MTNEPDLSALGSYADVVIQRDKTIEEQNTSILTHLETIRKLRSDFMYLAGELLAEADNRDMCEEYDEFVEKVNGNFQSSQRLIKRSKTVEFEVTVYVTATGRDLDEDDMISHLLNYDYNIQSYLESGFELDECDVDITS